MKIFIFLKNAVSATPMLRAVWRNAPFACILYLLVSHLAPQQGGPLHLDRSCAPPEKTK